MLVALIATDIAVSVRRRRKGGGGFIVQNKTILRVRTLEQVGDGMIDSTYRRYNVS